MYLKPEILQGNNQYFCEQCQKKVNAKKGVKFLKLPKLLSIIVNRFSFDYVYMRRIKLDDFFSFPFILNMNDYINGYEEIKNKLPEDSNPEYFKESQFTSYKPSTTTKPKATTTTKTTSTGKVARPSDGTKSFIQEMRKKKQETKGNTDDLIVVDNPEPNILKPPPLNEVNDIVLKHGLVDKPQDTEVKPQNQKKSSLEPPVQVALPKEKPGVQDKEKESEETDDQKKQKQDERRKQRAEERKELIEKYLKDGPLVYELYSILVHSGGAYGGHYYAEIKSFEEDKWYTFNDMTVREIDPDSLPSQTFGGNKSANGYMLFYKQIDSSEPYSAKVSADLIPENLRAELEEDAKKEESEDLVKVNKNMHLRVYFKLEVKQIPFEMGEKFSEFEKKAFAAFGITDFSNNRLRLYHPQTDKLMDTFMNKGDRTLQDLRIFSTKCLGIETKAPDQDFEEYEGDKIFFKVALWKADLPDLTEDTLNPKKIGVNKEGTIKQLMEVVSKEFEMPVSNLKLIKKVQSAGLPVPEEINKPENDDKTFFDCKLFENMMLYLEECRPGETSNKWKEAFDQDAFRYKIKFNNPFVETEQVVQEYPNSVTVDARSPLSDLKAAIAKDLKISVNEIILRKGGRLGVELKDLNQTVLSTNFVNGSSVYVEFGKPALPGELRIFVALAEKNESEFSFKFTELFETIINGENTAKEVKEKIAAQAKESLKLDWDPKKLRLRERMAERLTRVFRNTPIKGQGVTDKKQIAVEVLDEEEKIAPKENLVICRIWNPWSLEINENFEVIVDRNATLKDFAKKISEKCNSIETENLMGCKILGTWKHLNYDLLFQEWFSLNDEHNLLFSHPFYISSDGGVIMLKDKSLAHKELTEEEKKELGVIQQRARIQNAGGFGCYEPKVEKSMKITVKKKEDYAKEAEKKEEKIEIGNIQVNEPKKDIEAQAEKGDFEPFF